MSDRYLDNLLPDFGEYSLETVLENYRKHAAAQEAPSDGGPDAPAQPALSPAEAIAQRSRQIVMEALGETLSARRQASKQELDLSSLAPGRGRRRTEKVPALDFEMPDMPEIAVRPRGEEPQAPHFDAAAVTQAAARMEADDSQTPDPDVDALAQAMARARTARSRTPDLPDTSGKETSDRTETPERTETPGLAKTSDRPSAEKVPELDFDMSDLPEAPEGVSQPEAPAPESAPREDKPPRPRAVISPDGIITLNIELPREEPEQSPYEEPPEDLPQEEPIPQEPYEEEPAPQRRGLFRSRRSRPAQEEPVSASERFLAPLVRFAATKIARRQMQKAEAANWPDPVDIREAEELPPKLAAKFYGQQLRALRFRCRVCLFLCVTMAWICLNLPMAGILGRSLAIQAGVSMVLLIAVMVTALDIVAAGMRQLFDLHPGGEALAVLASVMSCIDAVMVLFGYGSYLPFCAVGAFSLSAALWGERLSCLARARSMRSAAMSKNPAAMTVEETSRGGRYICRTQRSIQGVVRRSEQADFCQNTYATAAPVLLALSVALAAVASMNGQGAYFLHTLSALLSVSASFTAFLSFPLPYSMVARKLQATGAAIVGYEGCADIGRCRRVVISDNDLFPPGTMKLNGINILEGALVDKVISCTTSLLLASGSGVAGVFMELVTRRGYRSVTPEEFRCHEGGGLSARVNDEQVLVGSVGFMNLMGIRLPQNMNVKNAVCTAISGELVGVFTLEYIPVSSVQDALVTLLQGRTQPIFAIRDFNITPLMIRQLFRMPTDNFNFPTFRDRYRLAGSSMGSTAPVAAVLSRGGMGPLVDAAEAGRKLYGVCRTGTVLSLIGTAIGMVTMFLLCRAGAYDTANAGNVLSYMFLWALPVFFLAYGQSR